MSPMLTMVGHCRQDTIIYKCTKLLDHSSNIANFKITAYNLPCTLTGSSIIMFNL